MTNLTGKTNVVAELQGLLVANCFNQEPRNRPPGQQWFPPENDRKEKVLKKQPDIKFNNRVNSHLGTSNFQNFIPRNNDNANAFQKRLASCQKDFSHSPRLTKPCETSTSTSTPCRGFVTSEGCLWKSSVTTRPLSYLPTKTWPNGTSLSIGPKLKGKWEMYFVTHMESNGSSTPHTHHTLEEPLKSWSRPSNEHSKIVPHQLIWKNRSFGLASKKLLLCSTIVQSKLSYQWIQRTSKSLPQIISWPRAKERLFFHLTYLPYLFYFWHQDGNGEPQCRISSQTTSWSKLMRTLNEETCNFDGFIGSLKARTQWLEKSSYLH